MNTRFSVSVALAAGMMLGLLAGHALPSAQAQTPPQAKTQTPPGRSLDFEVLSLQTQVAGLQQEVEALKAEVNLLQADLATSSKSSSLRQAPPDPRLSNIPPCQVTLLGQHPR